VLCIAACASESVNTQSATEERLTCQCGCGLTVHTCNPLQCSFAVPVRADIAKSLAAGESADAIIERYTAEYGEKVLSSPIPRGFNLVAWFGPYVALLISGTLIVLAIRRWSPKSGSSGTNGNGSEEGGSPGGSTPSTSMSNEERDRVRRALEDYDR
jgi:cytochrome c-type biogenesis protein CcmH